MRVAALVLLLVVCCLSILQSTVIDFRAANTHIKILNFHADLRPTVAKAM
jgi:hypothetical protein